MNTLQATLTRTWNNQPLVVLNGGPFNRTEATPAQLRALAAALVRAASLAELRPTEGRHWVPQTVALDLDPAPQPVPDREAMDFPIAFAGWPMKDNIIGHGWRATLPPPADAERAAHPAPAPADSGFAEPQPPVVSALGADQRAIGS